MIRIYCLFDTLENRPFYVGASAAVNENSILYRHVWIATPFKTKQGRDSTFKKDSLIIDRISKGIEIKVITLELVSKELAQQKEKEYYYRIKNLGYELYNDTSRFNYAKSWNRKDQRNPIGPQKVNR